MTAIIPPCAAACLAGVCGTALADTNKFEQKHNPDFSYADYYAVQYREFIKLSQALEQEWGKDKLLEFLTKKTQERTFKRGQEQAKKTGQ